MQLTIDSDTTLDVALRLVGAFYDVEISVAAAGDAATDISPAETPTRRPRGRSSAPGRRASAGRTGRRTRKPAGPRPRKMAASRGSATADIRSWAQANGHAVNSRGRIPAAVVEAYRASH